MSVDRMKNARLLHRVAGLIPESWTVQIIDAMVTLSDGERVISVPAIDFDGLSDTQIRLLLADRGVPC